MRVIRYRAWDMRRRDRYGKYIQPKLIYNIQDTYDEQGSSFQGVIENEEFIIEQFTGLLDKNGKEIYESDVVRFAVNELGGEVAVVVVEIADFLGGHFWMVNKSGKPMYEIIGNIHENPSLCSKYTINA